jgi:hypothetical protein
MSHLRRVAPAVSPAALVSLATGGTAMAAMPTAIEYALVT